MTLDQRTVAPSRSGRMRGVPSPATRRARDPAPPRLRRARALRNAGPRSSGGSVRAALRLVLERTWSGGGRAFRSAVLRTSVLFLDASVDLFTMDLHFRRGFDPELDLAGPHLEDRDLDGISDPNVFP